MVCAAPGLVLLFALRVALGFAESPSFPGAAQTIYRALKPEERARGFGILFTGSSIGSMLVPPIATTLNERYGWRVAILLTAAVGLLWVPLWLAIAFAPAARRALDAKTGGPRFDRAAPDAGSVRGTAEPADRKLTALELLTHPAQVRAILLVLSSAPFIAFVLNWGAKYLVLEHQLTQKQVGAYLWFPPLVFDFGAILFGSLSSRRTRSPDYDGSPDRWLVLIALALTLSACAMPHVHGTWPAMIIAAVAMGGGGALYALTSADVLARVPASAISTAGGICAASQSFAHILANPLIGWSVAQTHSYSTAILALALWNVPGALIWVAWTPPLPQAFQRRSEATSRA
jgi:MFS family permease